MTDEQAVRKNLARIGTVTDTSNDWDYARDALALLDAKDAEIALERSLASEQWGHRMAAEVERDEALAAKERAEAALAEERKAHQAALAAIVEAVRRADENICYRQHPRTFAHAAVEPLRPFLAAKLDPLVELFEALASTHSEEGCTVFNHTAEEIGLMVMENHEVIRAAIERAGGVKAVFGDDA